MELDIQKLSEELKEWCKLDPGYVSGEGKDPNEFSDHNFINSLFKLQFKFLNGNLYIIYLMFNEKARKKNNSGRVSFASDLVQLLIDYCREQKIENLVIHEGEDEEKFWNSFEDRDGRKFKRTHNDFWFEVN